ncbi:hypothetical protein FOMA001_g5667 [Fusarium oxysporum f. sp. matthiolae]|nr:hypothetical protein FOMA001_g5667 [Fusarium oxysporum f. sp. matthiolae]
MDTGEPRFEPVSDPVCYFGSMYLAIVALRELYDDELSRGILLLKELSDLIKELVQFGSTKEMLIVVIAIFVISVDA